MIVDRAPLVSVIIPFYNVRAYLEEAIESVLSQTTQDWELLLADDGSSDGSTEIARAYEKRFPYQIRYLQHPGGANKGAAATRNLALGKAAGTYVAFLDSDDKWTAEKLACQLGLATQYPDVPLICGSSLYWSSWRGTEERDKVEPVYIPALTDAFLEARGHAGYRDLIRPGAEPGDVILYPPLAAMLLYPLGEQSAPCPCSLLVRKADAITLGGFEEVFRGPYAFYEDQAFLVKLYLQRPVYISQRVLSHYRLRPDSVMADSMVEGHYDKVRYFFLCWLKAYLSHTTGVERVLRKPLRRAMHAIKKPWWKGPQSLLQKCFTPRNAL